MIALDPNYEYMQRDPRSGEWYLPSERERRGGNGEPDDWPAPEEPAEEPAVFRSVSTSKNVEPPDRPRPDPRPRSEVDPTAALADDWRIDGLLRRSRLLVVSAAEGVGKSYVKTEMGIRLTTGHGALFNHYRIPEPCRVLSFDVENGDEEETRREEEALATLGLERADLGEYWGVSLEGLAFGNDDDRAYIRSGIEAIRPAVVMFDTGSSMVGEEWGAELKGVVRFLRGLAREYGCSVVVFVHITKPQRTTGRGRGKPEPQHGASLPDVMGHWTKQADTVALMTDLGDDKRLWTVRKRAPHSQLVLRIVEGTFDVLQVVAGEDLGVNTTERVHGCIATGFGDAAAIATYLEVSERTVWRHVATLRKDGRVAADKPLRTVSPVSVDVSRLVSAAPRTNGAPVSVGVSRMSLEATDTVSPPIGDDSVSVSDREVGR